MHSSFILLPKDRLSWLYSIAVRINELPLYVNMQMNLANWMLIKETKFMFSTSLYI